VNAGGPRLDEDLAEEEPVEEGAVVVVTVVSPLAYKKWIK
jgi:hypothetical protein